MQFRELVLQGVRNFAQMHRLPLGAGLTVFVGGSGSGKTTVSEVIYHLLNPDPTEPGTERFQGADPNTCRAALLLEADDGAVYRLVQDLLRGSMALSRLDAASGRFQRVSVSPSEIRQYLGSQLHLPHADVLEGLFFVRERQLPSLAPPPSAAPPAGVPAAAPPGASQASGASAGQSGFPGFQGFSGMDPDEALLPDDPQEMRRQLETLRRDLAVAREVDDVQFELDGVQNELFELEQKSQGVKKAQQRVEQLEQQMQQYARLGQLPEDFEARVRDFEQAQARHERDSKRLEEECQRWEERSRESKPPPLVRDRFFLLGMGLGMLALLVGVAGFFLEEYLRWIALLDIPGFGVALFSALRHIDAGESVERAIRRLELARERQEKIDREFELATTIVRKMMAEFGVEKPAQILEQFAKRNELLAKLEQARAELAKLRADPTYEQNAARQEELRQRIGELEKRLEGAAGLMMSPQEMERRIGLLEQKLAGGAGPAAGPEGRQPEGDGDDASAFAFGPGAPPGAMRQPAAAGARLPPSALELAAEPAAGASGDHFQVLMKLADDVFLVERERIEAMLAPRAGQILAALSSSRWAGLSFVAGGAVQCRDASGNQQPAAGLAAADQDLVYLALHLAILEAAQRRQAVPLVLDNPYRRLPAAMNALVGRALQHLASCCQVIMLTDDASWASFANSSFQLG
ncbi:MAG: hypothetical protein DRI34_07970 [Deltaproteobacteria bacterium]|nr:MAG: hypothetical protein DRI34_07970 [Deltaproteobacteria bacterium]